MSKIILVFAIGKVLPFNAIHTIRNHRIVKLIIFLLLTGFCLHAGIRCYSQKVTLNVKNELLINVVPEIQRQTDFHFVYREELLQESKTVDLQVKQMALKDVLELCFKDQPLVYQILDHTIIVTKKESIQDGFRLSSLNGPFVNIKGKLITEVGGPIVGASIIVKRTGQGSITDENGFFMLSNVSGDETLLICLPKPKNHPKESSETTLQLIWRRIKEIFSRKVILNWLFKRLWSLIKNRYKLYNLKRVANKKTKPVNDKHDDQETLSS